MQSDLLIVEDLLLLMLDDETGVPAGAGTLYYTLGGAVLLELAMLGRIETIEGSAGLNGPRITPVGDGPLPDPLLQSAYDRVAEKTQRAQPLLIAIGGGLYKPVIERLLERGRLRRERRRVFGLFPTTRLPAVDDGYEAELRRKVCAVLEDGETPDPRIGAVIALLSASGTLPSLDPAPKWSGRTYHRAKELENGSWAAGAVGQAVARTMAAIAAGSTATTIVVISGTNS